MKLKLSIILLLILIPFLAICQNKKLVGTWYGKISDYQFKQDGTSQVFKKTLVKFSKEKLIIDKYLNYTYTYIEKKDTSINKGSVQLNGDSLIFILKETNSNFHNPNLILKYFLYHISKDELYYSNRTITDFNIDKKEDSIFEAIEKEAIYKLGENIFLKEIYSKLSKTLPASKDTSFLNKYSIEIDYAGIPNVSSLKGINAKPNYLKQIAEAIENLITNFIPAQQNGKPVTSNLIFKLNY